MDGRLYAPAALPPEKEARWVPAGSGEEKHFLLLPTIGPQFLGCPSNDVVTIPTMLSEMNTDLGFSRWRVLWSSGM